MSNGTHLALLFVVAAAVDLAGHSEIGHLDDVVFGQQDIAGRQVAVQHLNINSVERIILEICPKIFLIQIESIIDCDQFFFIYPIFFFKWELAKKIMLEHVP